MTQETTEREPSELLVGLGWVFTENTFCQTFSVIIVRGGLDFYRGFLRLVS